MFTATVSKNEHRWLALLFDISDLLQIMFIALELHIDHGTGVYKLNEFRFANPFVGYCFSLLEFDGIFIAIGYAEEIFIDRIVRYESSDVCKCSSCDASFLQQFTSGTGCACMWSKWGDLGPFPPHQ